MPSGPSRSPRPVRVECRKWPDDPHWEFDGVRLGVDAHGTWVGITEGTLLASPVRAFHAAADHVTLVPHDAWWLGDLLRRRPEAAVRHLRRHRHARRSGTATTWSGRSTWTST